MITFHSKAISRTVLTLALAVFVAFAVGLASAQTSSPVVCDPPEPPKAPKPEKVKKTVEVAAVGVGRERRVARNVTKGIWMIAAENAAVPQEKAIRVRPNVYVSVCVRRGAVKVNGWDREEVRAFNKGGKELGFKVIERGGKEQLPVWVEILGYEPDTLRGETDKCLTGEMIELDVPEGANVSIKGLSSETSIERVKTASIEIVGGDIYLDSITERIEASTQQGGVTVNNSTGKIALSTTTGNIVAYNTEPVEIGDFFKAKTRSGSLTLQSIGQKDVAASTISGSLNFLSEIKNYGKYDFTTTNGLINVVIPESSSFWLTAAYGGRFISELPIKIITEDKSDSAFRLTGRVGKGEANLSLKSFSGTIQIRKREGSAEVTETNLP